MLRQKLQLEQVNAEDVTAKQISGAMTNIIYRCNSALTEEVRTSPSAALLRVLTCTEVLACLQWVLVRVYGGVDDLFEREAECQIFAAVAQAGLGPRLLVSPAKPC